MLFLKVLSKVVFFVRSFVRAHGSPDAAFQDRTGVSFQDGRAFTVIQDCHRQDILQAIRKHDRTIRISWAEACLHMGFHGIELSFLACVRIATLMSFFAILVDIQQMC